MDKIVVLICLVVSNMSLVTSWSAMGSMNKMMNDMKELDTVSGLPSQIRQPKILQDPLLEPNPFIHDDAVNGPNFLGSSIENEFGSSGSTTSFKNDPLPVVGGLLLDSLDNDFDTPETFRTSGSQQSSLGSNGVPGGIDFSQGTRKPDGRLCIMKEEEVDTIVKEPVLECTHKNVEKCHYTYVTQFTHAKEEICEENFEKQCQITFKQMATTETVKKCYKPLKKVCNGQGPEECRTVYESSCITKYVEKDNGKFVGDTNCERLPIEICGAGCTTEEQPEECHDKEVSGIVNIPEEVCDLNPQKVCRLATKLVPKLTPKHECTIVPKETCYLRFEQPRLERKPLKSEWCLDESGPMREEEYEEGEDFGLSVDLRNDAIV